MIVIHIGLPKTGTTSIQRFLRDNAEALRARSIDYPVVGRERVGADTDSYQLKHSHLAGEVRGGARLAKKGEQAIAALVEHIGKTGCRTTVLSAEGFFKAPQARIEAFKQALSGVESDFRIVMVIRELIDAAPSGYAQTCKYGSRTDDFDAFFARRVVENTQKNFFDIAARWASVFGWPAIFVRLLSPAALLRGDLITDFLDICGLDEDGTGPGALARPARANESAGWRTTEALRAIFGRRTGLPSGHPLIEAGLPTKKSAIRTFPTIPEALARDFGWDKDRGLYLTRAQAELCCEKFDCWVARLNEHVSQKLPASAGLEARGFVERPFLPEASRIETAELRAFYDAWGAKLEADRNTAARRPCAEISQHSLKSA